MTTLKEDMKNKMKEIIWTEDVPKDNKKKAEANDKVENTQVESNPKTIVQNEVKSEKVASTETKKKRNVIKNGDKDWVSKLPEDQKFDEQTVFCFNPNQQCKVGRFKSYGKKEGIIWLEMFKKDSFEPMSREWAVRIDQCELVEKDGVLVNPELYSKDEKGYHVDKKKIKERAEFAEKQKEIKIEESTEIEKAFEINQGAENDPSKEIAAEDTDSNNEVVNGNDNE